MAMPENDSMAIILEIKEVRILNDLIEQLSASLTARM